MKLVALAFGVSFGVALFLLGKWYFYVTAAVNPHDAEGVSLNAMMPDAMNRWGCAELRTRFPDTVVPEGCKAADGASWRN